MKTKQFILMFAAMFLFLAFNPHHAYCQQANTNGWGDNSDELPGIIDSKVFLIAGGVIVTGLITYLIVKKSKDKSSSTSWGNQPRYLMASSYSEKGSFYDKMKEASHKSPVEIFTGTSDSKSPMDSNIYSGLAVGVRFKF